MDRPVETATVAGVALAGAVAVAVAEGEWDLWSAMVGAMLVLVLEGFVDKDQASAWKRLEVWAFSLVWGLCFTLMLAFAVEIALRWYVIGKTENPLFGRWGSIVVFWVFPSYDEETYL